MTINDAITAVSSVGFPIVACGVLMWFCNNLINKFGDKIDELAQSVNRLADKLE